MPFLPSVILDESNCKLVELDYYFKLEPLERVDVEIIEVLGLSKHLTSMQTIMMDTIHVFNIGMTKMQPVQGLYEYGIFSTFLPGNEVPGSFIHTSTLPKIYFTVPVHPSRKIRGLNIFSVYEKSSNGSLMKNAKLHFDHTRTSYNPIVTKVGNKTKRFEWIYGPSFFGVPCDGEQMIWLSHWKLGNQLEGGDVVKVSVLTTSELQVNKCGIEIVYDEQEEKMNTDQHTTDIARSFSGFDISKNLSPSDMATMGQLRRYFLCCRPEALRDSAVCFGNELTFDKIGGKELKRGGERYSAITAHDPWMPPDGRGCTMQVKAFFRSLPQIVDRWSPGRWRESYEEWRRSFENAHTFRYFNLSSQDLTSHTLRSESYSEPSTSGSWTSFTSSYRIKSDYTSSPLCMVDRASPPPFECRSFESGQTSRYFSLSSQDLTSHTFRSKSSSTSSNLDIKL
ncbi:uncharacterized protein LOC133735421 [Rosa rugosa]|uniref:uncharacterized protein LOC133735421 n=1 Tax=Rosa rugosa TaxID=74645 RepID=UPI002B408A24|nr:uncharacterized protein LOC133735421 [Rosa rugosa]